ncbi:hypothetical protein PC116_g21845 [Phytophthora cactorum]|nr:hypothetical protein Pcac1_g4881 [Phytophthora cactorum]KAG4229838.1 hypothetical protein PC116_g21845 [Phytophthora cactorum]
MSVFLTVDTTVAVCDAFNAVQEGEAKEGSSATTLTDRPCSEVRSLVLALAAFATAVTNDDDVLLLKICEKDLASAAVLR